MLFRKHRDIQLGTFDFPRTGFWAVHALSIPLTLYLGVKLAKKIVHRDEGDDLI